MLIKGFDGGNPSPGDAIIATFVWVGSATIDSVTDVKTTNPYTPIGNKYTLVESATSGGISMATYMATNVTVPTDGTVHAVRANLSQAVTDGGVSITSWTGVAPVFAQAAGAHSHAFGAGEAPTTAAPGPVDVGSGELIYAFTMANVSVGLDKPLAQGFTDIGDGSDANVRIDAMYRAPGSASTGVNPQWTWMFNSPGQPKTWLALQFVVKPATSGSNQPPTASFTSSCSALACNFTSTSSDPDGSIASYAWAFGDGGTANTPNASHSYAAAGSYTVTLTVTDNQGATNASSQIVTVSAANQAPTANFTSSCSGLTCSFTSTSSDPDGSIASYSWTFGDGATSTAQNPSRTYAAGGTYTVTLTVTDNQGAQSAPTSNSVTVTASNQAPTANFTFSCSGLTCNFTSTSSDPDGSIASYSWTFGDGATSTAQNPSRTYAAGGTYTVTLRVTDNQGAQSTTTSKTVTVTAPNSAPVVNAGSDETVVLGLLYTLSASFSDPDNGPWTYTIDWGDGSSSNGNRSTTGSISATHIYLGLLTTRTIRVTVTDSRGASGSDTKVVTLIL